MKLDQIEAFVRCAETGSISAAARSERLPKSTISRLISELEEALQTRLLDRSARGVVLTDEGRLFLEQGRLVLDAAQNAAGAFLPLTRGLRGVVRLTAPYSFGLRVLSPLLADFFARYPDIDVHLELSSRNVSLVEEGFDLAIRVADAPALVSRRIMHNDIKLAASPDYVREHGEIDHPEELESARLLVIGRPRVRASLTLLRGQESYFVRAPARLVASDPAIILRATLDGCGIGEIPWLLARPDLEAGRLVEVLPQWQLSGNEIFLLSPPARATIPRVRALAEFLLERIPGAAAREAPGRG